MNRCDAILNIACLQDQGGLATCCVTDNSLRRDEGRRLQRELKGSRIVVGQSSAAEEEEKNGGKK